MTAWRFFVTPVLILGMAVFVACNSKKQDTRVEAISEGEKSLKQAAVVEQQLGQRYGIRFMQMEVRERSGRKVNNQILAQDFNWHRLNRSERQEAKAKLFEYASLLERVLAMDAKKGVYVTHREMIVTLRDGAIAYQQSLQMFEQLFGEQFEPKTEGQPVFNRSREASAKSLDKTFAAAK